MIGTDMEMREAGLLNPGQLVREDHEAEGVFIAGFASDKGEVIAGKIWGGKTEKMKVPPAIIKKRGKNTPR